MAERSAISWTHSTFNPFIGCSAVSSGCAHCYAETLVKNRMGKDLWGDEAPRRRTSISYWRQPLKWNCEAIVARERRRVFVGSLCDWAEGRDDQRDAITDLWHVIRSCPQLDWLLLTKRPQNIERLLPSDWRDWTNGYPNVWLMTSIESATARDRLLQAPVLERLDHLLRIPAVVHGVSYEPALGPLADALAPYFGSELTLSVESAPGGAAAVSGSLAGPGVSWVICGGESGPGHRSMSLEWAREMRTACERHGVAFWFKQVSAQRSGSGEDALGRVIQELPAPRPSERRVLPFRGWS